MSEADGSWWFVVPVDVYGRRDIGSVKPRVRNRAYRLEQRHQMLDGEPVQHWEPIEYILENGLFGDYPREQARYRLCSNRLKLLIDDHKSELDPLEWLPAWVENEHHERRRYWVLNILKHPATELPGLEELDWATLREYVREGALDPFHVLPRPGLGLPDFLVSGSLRRAILDADLSVAFHAL